MCITGWYDVLSGIDWVIVGTTSHIKGFIGYNDVQFILYDIRDNYEPTVYII